MSSDNHIEQSRFSYVDVNNDIDNFTVVVRGHAALFPVDSFGAFLATCPRAVNEDKKGEDRVFDTLHHAEQFFECVILAVQKKQLFEDAIEYYQKRSTSEVPFQDINKLPEAQRKQLELEQAQQRFLLEDQKKKDKVIVESLQRLQNMVLSAADTQFVSKFATEVKIEPIPVGERNKFATAGKMAQEDMRKGLANLSKKPWAVWFINRLKIITFFALAFAFLVTLLTGVQVPWLALTSVALAAVCSLTSFIIKFIWKDAWQEYCKQNRKESIGYDVLNLFVGLAFVALFLMTGGFGLFSINTIGVSTDVITNIAANQALQIGVVSVLAIGALSAILSSVLSLSLTNLSRDGDRSKVVKEQSQETDIKQEEQVVVIEDANKEKEKLDRVLTMPHQAEIGSGVASSSAKIVASDEPPSPTHPSSPH